MPISTYHMAAHAHEKVKENLASFLHLSLHGRTLLEVVAVADDHGKVVTA